MKHYEIKGKVKQFVLELTKLSHPLNSQFYKINFATISESEVSVNRCSL